MTATIETKTLANIKPSPFRDLSTYPFNQNKLDALQRSIHDVGFWEGVIGRRKGSGVEIAFGHHRVEAARLAGLSKVPVIIRDLDDKQMLQFMGRENLEDYNSDFLVMLESWRVAKASKFGDVSLQKAEPIEIARLLGWTTVKGRANEGMNPTAAACSAASNLLDGGYLKLKDLAGLTVFNAREICTRAQESMRQLEVVGKRTSRPAAEVEAAKKHVGRAASMTAISAKEGNTLTRDLRGKVDVNAYRFAKEAKRQLPIFAEFSKTLANSIEGMLNGDASETRLKEIVKELNNVVDDTDKQLITRVAFELGELEGRAQKWKTKMEHNPHNVVPLKVVQ